MSIDAIAALRAAPGVASVLDGLGERDDVWVVGGAVRDVLLERVPRDLDLVVAGDASALAAEIGDVVAVHERFGTAEARAGELAVGVATARSERYPRPGALPEVAPASLERDLTRRDFSINAIAVDLSGGLHGVDGWRADLDAGRLRVLHDASFLDDPTRLWRAARYAARLGFAVDPETERLARAAIEAGALATVTGERLGGELTLALREPDPAAALTAACELGLLPGGARARRALARDALSLAPADADAGLIVLASMCGAVAPERLRRWLDELGLGARERDVVLAAVASSEPLSARLAAASRPSEIAAAARGRSVEEVALAGAIGGADAARRWLRDLRAVRLEIDGHDLLAAGVEAGPELGRRLAQALDARLDGRARGRDEELAAALEG